MSWLALELGGWLVEIVALLVGGLGVWLWGRGSARAKAEKREAEADRKTRERIDNAGAEIHGADPDAARRLMRERAANQR